MSAIYYSETVYNVKITLVDKSTDDFRLKGKDLDAFRKSVWQSGYVRKSKDWATSKITFWVSPFLITTIKVSEKK